jgi:hypothetical protein
MTRKKALEEWETKIDNCEITPRSYGPLRNPS